MKYRHPIAALNVLKRPLLSRIRDRLSRHGWYRRLHLAYARWRARHGGLPNWAALQPQSGLGSVRPPLTEGAKRVLIATGTAGHLPSMTMESLLGMALAARGVGIDFLLCDAALPACMMCEISWYSDLDKLAMHGPKDRCLTCYQPSAEMLDRAGLNAIGLNSKLTDADRFKAKTISTQMPQSEIAAYIEDGIPIGEHAVAGALRFFSRGDLETVSGAGPILRRYLEAALLTYYGTRRLLAEGHYDVVVLNHGIYVPQGIISETARHLGVRVVTWHPAYRRGCFIFNHHETYHHGLMTEPVSSWENMSWNDAQQQQITQYLRSRWVGRQDWVKFHNQPEFDTRLIEEEIGIDFRRSTIGLLTNVIWDAQLHYKANAFPNMVDWLIKTIAHFEKRPDLQLLIRVHPAELTGTLPSRQPVLDEIRHHFPNLPANVFIIPPESKASTYVAMSHCNTVLIYGTKMGVELSATGIPVVVAGEAWIRGKGVTMDANSEENYLRLLDALPLREKLDDATIERAQKYAYHFFFRRMVPLDCIKERKGWPPFAVHIDSLHDLAPGKSPGLDIVCNGIIAGIPFIYPAEDLTGAPSERRAT
ncbi:capsular polysaccharide export protein, LipB/KpsS family [Rhizobium hidalgonense]|uniref:capsular polysaccharide export protein, LipB/KpsS family n=1 Tax=Rhizobium hidalgonense TaxID=1538159 RepID=UPI0028721768|nr:capsular biosynthesis protein [Rhizobium hidalgonense]MDR9812652.1 capsular biosynthesis protein [Rhizobium hidalgonense]